MNVRSSRLVLGRITIFLILSTISFGCIQRIAMNSLGGILDNGFAVINEESDLKIAESSIASDLKLIESILRSDPDNTHYLLLASRGYSSYALGFVEDDSIPRARDLYVRGKEFGLRILRQNTTFAAAESKPLSEFSASLSSFSNDDVPAVFWTAVGWGSQIYTSLTDPSAVADLGKVESLMRFVAAHDSSYFYGGADFFLGTMYGSRAKMLGGDSALSRQYFERCLAINHGKFLMTYIYYARSYAVQTQDQHLFESLLTMIDTTSIDILPEARLSNAIAKRKAKLLRSKENDLF